MNVLSLVAPGGSLGSSFLTPSSTLGISTPSLILHSPKILIIQNFRIFAHYETIIDYPSLSPLSIHMSQVDICKGDLNCLNYCFCQVSSIFCIVDLSPVCNTIYSVILTFKLWLKSSTVMPLRWNPY